MERINFYDYVSIYMVLEKERERLRRKEKDKKKEGRMRYATRCEEFHFVLSPCSWDNVIMVNELANRI